jgi:putative ABC transport system permease protein
MALRHRLFNLFGRTRISQAIDDELQFHLDERRDELMAGGLGETDARILASRQFGNATLYKERTRNMNVSQASEDLLDDAAYAVRSLGRTRAFTAAAILTLALGIGATTAIYSVVRTVWLRPLPFRDPGRVVRIWETNLPLGIHTFSASTLNYMSWCERSTSFESLVAMQERSANLSGQGEPVRVASLAVTARFLDTLGIQPIRGRSFAAGEDQPGRGQVVMLSDRLWRERYGGDPNLVGRAISVNGENRTVIGIVPLEVGFANDRDVWEPLTLDPAHEDRGNHMIEVLGRLKAGVSVGRAEGELRGLAAQLEREFPKSNKDWRARMVPVLDWIVDRTTRTALVVLMATAGLLLLIACINVANLLLARASSRVQEFGIRRALGAGGARLARQLIAESLVLASAGGAAGLAVALAATRGLRAILSQNTPRASEISLDPHILAVAAALTLATGLLFGLAPAWWAARTDVHTSLRQGRGATASSGRLRLRQLLAAGEFALASVLVASAGLLLASFERLQSVSLGFEPRNVLTARISLPEARYSLERAQTFYRDLEADLKALPGAEAVGLASNVPFGGGNTMMDVARLDDAPADGGQAIQSSWRIVTPGYFPTLRVPLVRGRLFRDGEAGYPVILGEGLARRLWPDGRDPIGRSVRFGRNRPRTVVGVVADVRHLLLTDDPAPTVYIPTSWTLWDPMIVVVRTPGDPAGLASALRHAVAKLDPQQPIFGLQTMEDLVEANSAGQRLNTFLVGSFALLALVLGVVGVAGVVSYAVVQRTPEMAVRMALGATPGGIVRTVMADGLRMCAVGLVPGLVSAYLLGRAMAGLLFQVQPGDPAILGAVAAVLLAASLVASWLPARRIASIDPVIALRKE